MKKVDIRLVTDANLEQIASKGLFDKELRRIQEYKEDNPEENQEIVAQTGEEEDKILLLSKIGDKEYFRPKKDLEKIASMYNHVIREGGQLESDQYDTGANDAIIKIDLEELACEDEDMRLELKKHGKYESSEEQKFIRIDEKIEGFEQILVLAEGEDAYKIYGLPTQKNYPDFFFHIGTLKWDKEDNIGTRRYLYIFGKQAPELPEDDNEEPDIGSFFIENLSKLYKLADEGDTKHDEEINYNIEKINENQLDDKTRLIYDQARDAQSRDLFSKIELYSVTEPLQEFNKQIVVCYDHFDQIYPVMYSK